MNIRIRKLKAGDYSVTWASGGIRHSARRASLAAAVALRGTIGAVEAPLPVSTRVRSDVAQEWQIRGGLTRVANMTPEERTAAARHAANVRWGKG
jgi:hypothetical protein